MKYLLSITIALLPSTVLAEQFTPEQLIEVMTKSPSNRDVRVHDCPIHTTGLAITEWWTSGWEDEWRVN